MKRMVFLIVMVLAVMVGVSRFAVSRPDHQNDEMNRRLEAKLATRNLRMVETGDSHGSKMMAIDGSTETLKQFLNYKP